jgi:hypothetical protein
MRRLIILSLAVLVAGLPARGEEPVDTIQAVIADQLRAFEAKDLDAAFAHASPGIQSRFSTPEKFGNMVAAGSALRLLTWLPRPLYFALHRLLAGRSTTSERII